MGDIAITLYSYISDYSYYLSIISKTNGDKGGV